MEHQSRNKRFGGVAFSLLELRANSFDGYGITFFTIRWDWLKIVTMSNSYSLLFFNVVKVREYGGEELRVRAGILFMFFGTIYSKVLKPRKAICDNCADYCETTEHYVGDTPYCSTLCKLDGTY